FLYVNLCIQNDNMTQFTNQVAVITGAASGIGNAIARQLHTLGAHVALVDRQQGTLGVQDENDRISWFLADITQESRVGEVIKQVIDRYGQIDVLVNSAGITGKTNIQSHDVDSENLHAVFDVNFFGSFFMAKYT